MAACGRKRPDARNSIACAALSQPSGPADLGIREEWLPLFDAYNVDLVVCGHERHYERSLPLPLPLPLRGCEDNRTRTPKPAALTLDRIDTGKGAVRMVLDDRRLKALEPFQNSHA